MQLRRSRFLVGRRRRSVAVVGFVAVLCGVAAFSAFGLSEFE